MLAAAVCWQTCWSAATQAGATCCCCPVSCVVLGSAPLQMGCVQAACVEALVDRQGPVSGWLSVVQPAQQPVHAYAIEPGPSQVRPFAWSGLTSQPQRPEPLSAGGVLDAVCLSQKDLLHPCKVRGTPPLKGLLPANHCVIEVDQQICASAGNVEPVVSVPQRD